MSPFGSVIRPAASATTNVRHRAAVPALIVAGEVAWFSTLALLDAAACQSGLAAIEN